MEILWCTEAFGPKNAAQNYKTDEQDKLDHQMNEGEFTWLWMEVCWRGDDRQMGFGGSRSGAACCMLICVSSRFCLAAPTPVHVAELYAGIFGFSVLLHPGGTQGV